MSFIYPEIDIKKTGEKIRQLCKERKLMVTDLQEYLFIGSNQAVYNWFNGRSLPQIETLFALAELLEVSMDELIIRKS